MESVLELLTLPLFPRFSTFVHSDIFSDSSHDSGIWRAKSGAKGQLLRRTIAYRLDRIKQDGKI